MKTSEIKKMLISSLDADYDTLEFSRRLEEEGISFDFKKGFGDRVFDKLFTTGITINRELEFVRSMNFVFRRIALTGVAAILVLLVSIFLMEGSLSLNSFLGLSENYDESIVCLLTGN